MDSTTSLASGCAERMKLSVQQVHSSPCSHSTGRAGLGFHGVGDLRHKTGRQPQRGGRERAVLHELRREMPWRRITS
jgi:hypothetical protein